MEERIARLESHVEHIQSDVTEIKTDQRSMFRLIIGSFVLLASMIIASTVGMSSIMAKGFGWL